MFTYVVFSTTFGAEKSKGHTVCSGICQLIETRGGRTSCWGVIVTFDRLTLKDSVAEDRISITDAKYDRNLKPIMTWSVSDKGKRLTIEFKPGMGDFGTGNAVTVRIDGTAFRSNPIQTYVFAISTDRL